MRSLLLSRSIYSTFATTKLGTAVTVGLLVISLTLGIAIDSIQFRNLAVILFCLISLGIFFIPYRIAIFMLFIYLGFEGMAKLVSGYNPVVHVGADILVLCLGARYILSRLMKGRTVVSDLPPFYGLLFIHYGWFLVQFSNPNGLGLIPSLAAAKVYVTMTLLYFFGYNLTKTKKDITYFMIPWLVVAFVQVITSISQAAMGPLSVLAISPQYGTALQKYEGYAFRPFGTTSQPGMPSIFLFLTSGPILFMLLFSKKKWLKPALTILLGGIVFTLLICQVRSALLKFMVGAIIFLGMLASKAPVKTRKKILIVGLAGGLIMTLALPRLIDAWSEGSSEGAAAIGRTLTLFDLDKISGARAGALDRIVNYATDLPLGAGLSRSGPAAGKFSNEIQSGAAYKKAFFTDNFWAAMIAESGIPGAFILTSLILSILYRSMINIRKTKDVDLRAAGVAVWGGLFAIVMGLWGAEGILYNPEAAYFWFFSGVLMKFPKLSSE